jgi:hypothetical protein
MILKKLFKEKYNILAVMRDPKIPLFTSVPGHSNLALQT